MAAASSSDSDSRVIDTHLVAGATSGFLATLMLHPLDLIKTRFHVQEHGSQRLPYYSGLFDALRTIVRLEGWRGLYGGLAPNIIGNTASWGVYMCSYNRCKDVLHERGYSGSPLYIGAASVAGALTTMLLHPVFMVKTRLQLQLNTTAAAAQSGALPSSLLPVEARDNYAGAINAVRRMVQEEGVVSLYRGIGPSMLLVSHGAIQFLTCASPPPTRPRPSLDAPPPRPCPHGRTVLKIPCDCCGLRAPRRSYEKIKKELMRRHGGGSSSSSGGSGGGGGGGADVQLGADELMFASTASKICAILCTYPYQVVRSCVQQRQVVGADAVRYSSAGDTVRHIWRLEGAPGFYRGIWAHMLRSTPQATITLMLYEYSMRALAMLHPSTPHELV